MIDEEWLRSLEFDSPSGRVTGLVGLGSQFLVFKCMEPDGTEVVTKIPNSPLYVWGAAVLDGFLTAEEMRP
jgi:hypothetical protein